MLFMQASFCAFALAEDRTGNTIAARIAMMAMTTKSSISVKARCDFMRIIKLAWIRQFLRLGGRSAGAEPKVLLGADPMIKTSLPPAVISSWEIQLRVNGWPLSVAD